MSWEEIKNGYGLQPVPELLAKSVCCVDCDPTKTQYHLYTDNNLTKPLKDWVLQRIWCKFHAINFFDR